VFYLISLLLILLKEKKTLDLRGFSKVEVTFGAQIGDVWCALLEKSVTFGAHQK